MMWVRGMVLAAGTLVCAALPCAATPVINVNGTYQLTVVDSTDSCTFTGQAMLNQSGANFTGTVSLTLVSGLCPASIGGNVNGSLSGNTINFGIGFSVLGTANFSGTISNDGNTASGMWSQVMGDAAGTWSASRTQHAAPALSAWSLAALTLLLAWCGMRRRVRAA